MIIVTPMVSVATQDQTLSPNPQTALPFTATPVNCPTALAGSETTLPASSSNVAVPAPLGVTTALVLAIVALSTTDLIVKVNGQSLSVPFKQTLFLYNVVISQVTVSTVAGGKISYLVGG